MGNVYMEASQINYRGGNKKMSVEEALKAGSGSGAIAAIAPEFSEEAQYSAGDLVFYEGELFRFEEDHDPGAWDSTEVMGTSITDNLVMLPGDGLQRILHEFAVKLKADGGLHFDANGAIYADHLPDYRLLEHDTKQQWIDGSPIYSKTIDFGGLPNTNSKTVLSGLSGVKIVKIEGIASSNSYMIPLPEASSVNQNVQMYYDYANNSIVVITSGDYSPYTESFITLYYTKNE